MKILWRNNKQRILNFLKISARQIEPLIVFPNLKLLYIRVQLSKPESLAKEVKEVSLRSELDSWNVFIILLTFLGKINLVVHAQVLLNSYDSCDCIVVVSL